MLNKHDGFAVARIPAIASPEKPVALVGSENVTPAPPPTAAARIVARVKAVLAERGDSRLAQLVAGSGPRS